MILRWFAWSVRITQGRMIMRWYTSDTHSINNRHCEPPAAKEGDMGRIGVYSGVWPYSRLPQWEPVKVPMCFKRFAGPRSRPSISAFMRQLETLELLLDVVADVNAHNDLTRWLFCGALAIRRRPSW